MSLLAKMLRREEFRVSLNKEQSTFLYREGGRQLHVSGEAMPDGYAVYSASIKQWENAPTELIDDNERLRIAANIRRYFVDRGKNVYLS